MICVLMSAAASIERLESPGPLEQGRVALLMLLQMKGMCILVGKCGQQDRARGCAVRHIDPCLQMIELGAQRRVLQGSSTALEHVTEKFGFFRRKCGQHLALHHIGRSRAGGDSLLPGLR